MDCNLAASSEGTSKSLLHSVKKPSEIYGRQTLILNAQKHVGSYKHIKQIKKILVRYQNEEDNTYEYSFSTITTKTAWNVPVVLPAQTKIDGHV